MKKLIDKCVQFFNSWFSLLFILVINGLTDTIVQSTLTTPLKICFCLIISLVQLFGIIFIIIGAYKSKKDLGIFSWLYIIILAVWLILSTYVNVDALYTLIF